MYSPNDQAMILLDQEALENEMYEVRSAVHAKLSTVVHPQYLEMFTKFFSCAWCDGLAEARKLAHELNLSKLDFAAVDEDEIRFKELVYADF